MNQPPASEQQLLEQIGKLEERVRKLSEEKANLYLVLHMVELLNPIAGLDSLVESLISALGGSLGGNNVEIYYLDQGKIQYANLFGERRELTCIEDDLVAQVFRNHQFIEQSSDSKHTLLQNTKVPIACTWVMPLMLGSELIGAIKMSDLLGSAQMRAYLTPFFSHMALILNNQIKTKIAETANRAKSNFLATMSHEIRTPLNGILGMAQLMAETGCSAEKSQECAQTILASGQILLALLNDVLDLSKIEAERLELALSPTNPDEIITQVQALFSATAKQKHLTITSHWNGPDGIYYRLDPVRIRQMLANLVSNAIKFSDSGTVRIDASQCRYEDQQALLEFSVADDGIGIADDQQHLLFQPFSQIDASSTRRYSGTGLGLSIVHRLATLMGGETGVESSPGHGARFWFRLPCVIDAKSMTAAQTLIGPASQAPHTNQPEPTGEPGMSAAAANLEPSMSNLNAFIAANPCIKQILGELEQLLERNLFLAISRFKEMQCLIGDDSLNAHFNTLGELINQMKFEEAHQQLLLMLQSMADGKSG